MYPLREALGIPYSSLSLLKGAYRKDKKLFTMKVVRLRIRLPREIVKASLLEVSKARQDGALSNLV